MQRSLQNTVYHSLLRIALCVCAFLVVFDSGIVSQGTIKLSDGAQQYLASAVGVRVGVAQTELEYELAAKDREIAVALNTSQVSESFNTSTFVLSAILFVLLVLIVLNYILDYLRQRSIPRQQQFARKSA
jgi:hypothetical protein